MSVISCQLSALEVILKFEDLEGWKRSSQLCSDLYKHFQDIIDMLLLKTENCYNTTIFLFFVTVNQVILK